MKGLIFLLGWCIGIWSVIMIELIAEKIADDKVKKIINEGEGNEK